MFDQLIPCVDLLRNFALDFFAKKEAVERQKVVLPMLEVYFYLKDLVDEGETLIVDAGACPIETIRELPQEEAALKLCDWDLALKRQAFRLRKVSQLIFAQDFLEVVSPELRDRLDEAVGSKFKRANSLHGIGAALFMRAIFPLEKTDEDRARYICVMTGAQDDWLDVDRAKSEISLLRSSLEKYQAVVMQLISSNEIVSFSSQAREATCLGKKKTL